MPKKKTHSEFILDVSNLVGEEYSVIGKYIGIDKKVRMRHNLCGYEWGIRPAHFLHSNSRCPQCIKSKYKNPEWFVQKVYDVNQNVELLSDCNTRNDYVDCRCKLDSYIWRTKMSDLLRGVGCPVCAKNITVPDINTINITHPKIASMLANQDYANKLTAGGKAKVDWVCNRCHRTIKNKCVDKVIRYGLSCPFCSDGISFPNKLMSSVLSQLNINFECEKVFGWSLSYVSDNKALCGKKIYDFYLPDNNTIIEMHGRQHYDVQFSKNGRSLEFEKLNDAAKRNSAIKNGIDSYIIVNCKFSDLDYIKNSLLHSEFANLFDLSSIDWGKCYSDILVSKKYQTFELWNNGEQNISKLAELIGVTNATIRNYLKDGTKHTLCNYWPTPGRSKKAE